MGTFTGRHGKNADYDNPQPGFGLKARLRNNNVGAPEVPRPFQKEKDHGGERSTFEGGCLHHRKNGRKVEGTVKLGGKERVEIELASLPSEGMNFIQLQNKDGLFSNDFIFHASDKKIDPPQLREKAGGSDLQRKNLPN